MLDWILSFFAPAPVTVAPVTPVVQPYMVHILHSHKPSIVAVTEVRAQTESQAVSLACALAGERVQVMGGGRYRCHGSGIYTRIDGCPRNRPAQRKANRDKRKEDGPTGIVGE
jgi:hypothetical protein